MALGLKRRSRFQSRDRRGERKGRRKWMPPYQVRGRLLGVLLLTSASVLCLFFLPLEFFKAPVHRTLPAGPESEKAPAPMPPHRVIEGQIKEGSSFFKSLAEKGIAPRWIETIISHLKPYVNFRKIRGGVYRIILDVKGDLQKFVFETGPTEIYEVEKKEEEYAVQKVNVPLDVSIVTVAGEIRSSLFEAMDAVGEQDQLVISFAEILASEIDFYKDVKEGDRFKVLVEKAYKGTEFIRYGILHAVEYQRGEKTIRGIRYGNDYYDERGNSLRKAFLRSPLRFSRISSRFSRARNHPILGGLRPHYGVDYAAPVGTPIWAVSDGTVQSCGWNGGFGKQVILRHGNGYVTCYGHLSAYGAEIRRGVRVKQKQVIGYVGSTGLSTGPHLDFRLTKDGKFRNPLRETFPAGTPLRKEEIENFGRRRSLIPYTFFCYVASGFCERLYECRRQCVLRDINARRGLADWIFVCR